MAKTKSRFFSVMVIGDNPDEILSKYDVNRAVEPYVKYRYLDAKKLQNNAMKLLNGLIENSKNIGLTEFQLDLLRERLVHIKSLSPFEYYTVITDGMYYDENGDAITDENPNGKWVTASLGSHFSLPLILKDGSESYQAYSDEIDWVAMSSKDKRLYEAAWDVVVDGKTPSNEEEEQIYNSMKDKVAYFSKFKNKESYVKYSCSYWAYALVNEEEWVDMDSSPNTTEWVTSFIKMCKKKITKRTLVSIYECTINDDKNIGKDKE